MVGAAIGSSSEPRLGVGVTLSDPAQEPTRPSPSAIQHPYMGAAEREVGYVHSKIANCAHLNNECACS